MASDFQEYVVEALQDTELADEYLRLSADDPEALKLARANVNESKLIRMVSGALRNCIDAHGPITKETTGSAAKRIVKQLMVPKTK